MDGGHQLTWSARWGCSPRLTDASVKWQTHGRKIASWDGSVSVPQAAKILLVPPSLSNIDTGNLLHSSEAELNDSSLSYESIRGWKCSSPGILPG